MMTMSSFGKSTQVPILNYSEKSEPFMHHFCILGSQSESQYANQNRSILGLSGAGGSRGDLLRRPSSKSSSKTGGQAESADATSDSTDR